MNRTEALEILMDHLETTATEDEGYITEESAEEYAFEVADTLEDNDDGDVAEAIRVLAS